MTHQIRMKVYIAGPMTGLPDDNYPAFNQAEKQLFVQGHQPLNPAKNKASTWIGFMRRSLHQIAEADCLYMLAGWQTSKGAKIEHQLALDLHLPIFYENELKPTNKPESPDIIKAATKEVAPGVKEGWTAASSAEEAQLAEKAVQAAYAAGKDTLKFKKAERFVLLALDVHDKWVRISPSYADYAKAERVKFHILSCIPGLPISITPVEQLV